MSAIQHYESISTKQVKYYGDIPANTLVYVEMPESQSPLTKQGEPSNNPKIVGGKRCEVRELLHGPDLQWHTITLRANERGFLQAHFARRRVWLVSDHQVQEECYSYAKMPNG